MSRSRRGTKAVASYAEDSSSSEAELKKKSRQRSKDDDEEAELEIDAAIVSEHSDEAPSKPKKVKKKPKKSLSSPALSMTESGGAALQRTTSALGATEWVPLDPVVAAKEGELKIVSLNVAGVRSFLPRTFFDRYMEEENPDILCLQETKTNPEKKDGVPKMLGESHPYQYWSHSRKPAALGYAGTAIFSKIEPLSVKHGVGIEKFDLEGRVITLEFKNVFLVASYHPNSGKGGVNPQTKLPANLPNRSIFDLGFEKYVIELKKTNKEVVVVGDLNVAPQGCDLYNPKGNKKTAGFTQEERDNFARLLVNAEMSDIWRHFNPVEKPEETLAENGHYSYWSVRRGDARSTNKGWRVDLALISNSILDSVSQPFMRREFRGSDHTSIGFIAKANLFQ